jgi:glycosyltransferase involved in cell wall biosynthesis
MLQEAIQSILGQTFRDFEIVVVNDAGRDVEDVLERSQNQARIVHVRHQIRRDRSAARNTALCLAQGKYIAYLDDDDVFYPDHLASLLEVLRVTGRKVAYSDACQAHQAELEGRYTVIRRDPFPSEDFSANRLLVSNFIPILCVVHERSCLEATGGFDASLGTHEDWDLWIRMSRHQAFVHLRQMTCEFRSRDDGSTTTSTRKADFLRTTEVIHRRYRMYAEPLPDVLQKQVTFVSDLRSRIERETRV